MDHKEEDTESKSEVHTWRKNNTDHLDSDDDGNDDVSSDFGENDDEEHS